MIIWGGGDPGFCRGEGWFCCNWNVVVTVQIALHIVLLPEKEQNFHQLRVMPQEIMVRMVHCDCPPCWVQCWCAVCPDHCVLVQYMLAVISLSVAG